MLGNHHLMTEEYLLLQGPCHIEPFLWLWAGLRPVRLQPRPIQTTSTCGTLSGFTVAHLPDWVWRGSWSWRVLQWLLWGASGWLSRSSIKDSLTHIHQHNTIQAVQRTPGRTWWQGVEVPMSKVGVPLSRLRSPAKVFLRIGGIVEEMMGQGENLWKVKRQQRLLLLLLFHTQFLRMFSSLSQAW